MTKTKEQPAGEPPAQTEAAQPTPTPERTTTVAELRAASQPREAGMPIVRAGFGDLQGFELLQRSARAIAASTLVPTQFQGNLPNCIIALEMAQRIGASPLMVAQNLYVVHGRPSWSAKFLIATFNQCGRFSAIRYEWSGKQGDDAWGCRAFATEKSTGTYIRGALITIAMAKKEGWYQKTGSKWQTIPEQMLMYRAAAWLVNTHAPEISMGLNTEDELHDVYDAQRSAGGVFEVETAPPAQAGNGAEPPATEQERAAADASWLDEIRECGSLTELDELRKEIIEDYLAVQRKLPLPVDAALSDRQAALEQG